MKDMNLNGTELEDTRIKPQKITVKVSTGYARVAANTVWAFLKNRFGYAVTTELEGFADDPEQLLVVRFMETDETAQKVSQLIKANFTFTE